MDSLTPEKGETKILPSVQSYKKCRIVPPRVVKANPAACQRIDRCAINCLAGKVEFLDTIRDICTAEEIILIRTEDRDFRNGCLIAPFVKDNREQNNVNAYDWAGNHLWNIGELVGDIKMAFDGITHITPAEAKREFGIKVKRNARCLFRCVAGGFVFVIDAENRKIALLKLLTYDINGV